MILVFSCSLNPGSRSVVLARALRDELAARDSNVELIDLRETPLPLCDGANSYGDATVVELNERVSAADAIVVAAPVYNFDVNAAAKNLVELTGRSWTGKVVGMLLAAGGEGSYMSAMGLANSLMLDFRCIVVPRFVYTTEDKIDGDVITEPVVRERIVQLADDVSRLSTALKRAE
ncbi:NADPH-dependent FMN reductase [Stratiformator vulcanicus]|uniref:NAD(P)H-dependent FAD/FMN reductase n=1 Tax=Stratiformator vulcanicus TaxID=2527980 RepID=A0A517QZR0_9PLAN|nr:NAD(P)H-dependent oxidoreductase [Stratiformator vulcanicus]QDT37083.1 NAD(P)H-dependent FAD/FMN reductase [Stratiformator vulcanicus]